jgi:8-oxo-dGTP pyrophosphatase MutT (NUDIX family)
MDADYPEHLLAREAAPPYDGEGPFALWHFSEDPGLGRFRPHTPAANPGAPPLVWAVDTRHAPMFWFPRDCPRGCAWPVSATTPEDRERFFGQSGAGRLHVMESAWLGRMQSCRLYAYRLPEVPACVTAPRTPSGSASRARPVPAAAHRRRPDDPSRGQQPALGVSWHLQPEPPDGKNHGSSGVCLTPARDMVLVSADGVVWGLPGGRPEGDESFEETLRREVSEEACARVSATRPPCRQVKRAWTDILNGSLEGDRQTTGPQSRRAAQSRY